MTNPAARPETTATTFSTGTEDEEPPYPISTSVLLISTARLEYALLLPFVQSSTIPKLFSAEVPSKSHDPPMVSLHLVVGEHLGAPAL